MIKIAIIILNWNRAELTLASASSVIDALATVDPELAAGRLFIVDNASAEADIGRLRAGVSELSEHMPSIDLAVNQTNLGYAAGMNTGIRHALNWEADYIWLLNNDTLVDRSAISALIDFSQQDVTAVIVGSTMIDPESRTVLTAGGYRYFRWLGWHRANFAGRSISSLDDSASSPPRLDYIDGAALWLRGDFVRRIAGLPEEHFLYFEEISLQGLLKNDESIAWCPTAIVYHLQAGSAPSTNLQARGTYHAAFSAFSYTLRQCPLCLPTVIMSRILGVGIRAIARKQPQLFTAVLSALIDFTLGRLASYPRPSADVYKK